jgi:hypothetical protein
MKKIFVLLLIVTVMGWVSPTWAGPVDPNFTLADSINTLERLEFRTGKNLAQDWEIGLGTNTQSAGQFANANVYDTTWWTVGKTYSFNYGIDTSGVATFSLSELGINLTWNNFNLGNAVQIHAKRDVEITFGGVSVTGDPLNAFGLDYGYINVDPLVGFSLAGTIKFNALGTSGSTQGVEIYTGNVPTPEPTSMLLLGFGLIGLAGFSTRRKK